MSKNTERVVVYRGHAIARVPDHDLTVRNNKAYRLPEHIALDLVNNHAGFSWSKKDKAGPQGGAGEPQ